MPTLPSSNAGQPEYYRSATGELYYWSERERCYVFQSGRRVASDGQLIQPAEVPRSSAAQLPVSSFPADASGSSAASAGSQSPVYTTATLRDRAQSFTSASGSSGHGAQYEGAARSPQASVTSPQISRSNAAIAHGRGGGLLHGVSSTSTFPAQMAALSITPSNSQVPEHSRYQLTQNTQLGTSPRTRDWYPAYQPHMTPSNASAASTSRAPLTAAAAATTQHPGPVRPAPPRREFKATPGEYEELDPRYRRRPSKFFTFGRVFKMHWSEPDGRAGDDTATVATGMKEPLPKKYEKDLPRDVVRSRRFGEHIYSKIRWFIVVRAGEGKCLCVPIITYGGQGVSKPGVVKNEHAIVHTSKAAPDPIPGEIPRRNDEKPMRTAIRVTPDDIGDKFQDMSRIDYSRIYTVESYVKARAFGNVHESSEKDLWYNFREVFLGSGGLSDLQSGQDPHAEASDGDEDESGENNDSNEENNDEGDVNEATTRSTRSKGKAPVRSPAGTAGPSTVSAAQIQAARQNIAAKSTASSSQAAQIQAARLYQQRLALHAAQTRAGGSHGPATQSKIAGARAEQSEDDSEEQSSENESSGDE